MDGILPSRGQVRCGQSPHVQRGPAKGQSVEACVPRHHHYHHSTCPGFLSDHGSLPLSDRAVNSARRAAGWLRGHRSPATRCFGALAHAPRSALSAMGARPWRISRSRRRGEALGSAPPRGRGTARREGSPRASPAPSSATLPVSSLLHFQISASTPGKMFNLALTGTFKVHIYMESPSTFRTKQN